MSWKSMAPVSTNKNKIKKIGVLTSGGDSPGMNAAVRAITRTARAERLEVVGIQEGFRGLARGGEMFRRLGRGDVGDIVQRGGTILRSARLPGFKDDRALRDRCYANLQENGINALVVLGGDGSFQGAALLSEEHEDLRVAGVPCTIDNDIAYTDYTIGFDTAVNTCVNCINNLRDTMASHERISVVEVMGRSCGDIAVYAGIASGAEAILIPEVDRSDEEWLAYVAEKLQQSRSRKKDYGIIVMAEGMYLDKGKSGKCTAQYVVDAINSGDLLNFEEGEGEARAAVLGHLQRGGSPSASDRILASRLGYHAVYLLMDGGNRRCLGMKNNALIDEDIRTAVAMKRTVRDEMIHMADVLAR